MIERISVRGLFETHLTVSDLKRSVGFYRDVLRLPIALEVPERNAAFLWVGDPGRSMLGLWSLGSAPLGLVLHVAFEVGLDNLLEACGALRAQGITPLSFFGEPTDEPSVIGWMPAGGCLLPRSGWSSARIPRDARRAAKARRRSRHLVGVDGASRVIALASRTFVSRTMQLQRQACLQLRHRLVHPGDHVGSRDIRRGEHRGHHHPIAAPTWAFPNKDRPQSRFPLSGRWPFGRSGTIESASFGSVAWLSGPAPRRPPTPAAPRPATTLFLPECPSRRSSSGWTAQASMLPRGSVNDSSQLLYRHRHYSCPLRTIVPMVWPWTSLDL